MSYTQIKF